MSKRQNVKDEIILAELVARLKSRGMGTVHGPPYADADGNTRSAERACRACAYGAYLLDDDTDLPLSMTETSFNSLIAGFENGVTRTDTYQPYEPRAYAIGATLDDAMGQPGVVGAHYTDLRRR